MRHILFFILLGMCFQLKAQDTLYKANGTVLVVKIIEVNATQVKYKSKENINGPTFVIGKNDVIKVVYQTGVVAVFQKNENAEEDRIKDPRNLDFGQNFISINLADFLAGNSTQSTNNSFAKVTNGFFTIGFEHIFKSGSFSLKCPLSIGLNAITNTNPANPDIYSDFAYYNPNKIYSTGLDIYAYPFGQGRAKFFCGPSFEFGEFYYYYEKNIGPLYYYYSEIIKDKTSFASILLQAGYLFQPTKNVNFSFNFGAGLSEFKRHLYYVSNVSELNSLISRNYTVARVGINIGYKF